MSGEKQYSPKIIMAVFSALLAAAFLTPGEYQLAAAGLAAAVLAAMDRGAFADLGRPRFWIFVLAVVFITPAFAGEKNLSLLGVPYSGDYLKLGIRILLRGLGLYMAILLLTRNVSVEALAGVFERLGFRDLSVTLPIALNLLPVLRRNCIDTIRLFRNRGGFRRNRARNMEKLILTILLYTVRTAEEIYHIIEMKKLSQLPERKF